MGNQGGLLLVEKFDSAIVYIAKYGTRHKHTNYLQLYLGEGIVTAFLVGGRVNEEGTGEGCAIVFISNAHGAEDDVWREGLLVAGGGGLEGVGASGLDDGLVTDVKGFRWVFDAEFVWREQGLFDLGMNNDE